MSKNLEKPGACRYQNLKKSKKKINALFLLLEIWQNFSTLLRLKIKLSNIKFCCQTLIPHFSAAICSILWSINVNMKLTIYCVKMNEH